jgi:hypothetical protein
VADVLSFDMPVKAGLELRTIVGLDEQNSEGQAPEHLVDEADSGTLIAGVLDLKHPDAGAVVDSRELIQTLVSTWDALQELHIQLQTMAWKDYN